MKRNMTGAILTKMLHENTGIHMMDSGGENRRNWQHNKTRNFAKESPIWATEDGIRRSTYHFLKNCLDYDAGLTAAFFAFSKKNDNSYHQNMADWLADIGAKGIDGEREPECINTYNHESTLDQVIQYIPFDLGGKAYVILQIHGGADVRGGYTKPRVFRSYENEIMYDADAMYGCGCGESDYRTDNAGYSWYNNIGQGRDIKLADLPKTCSHCGKPLQFN